MLKEVIGSERSQFLVLVGLSLFVVILTAAAYALDRHLFERLLGKINPLVAIVVIVLVGGLLLLVFVARDWFAIYTPWDLSSGLGRYVWPAALAVFLAVMMSLVDSRAVLSEDINAPFPHSLLYYPVVGYAAEIFFHVVPLFLLLTLLTSLSKSLEFETIVWPCIIIVSLIEPVFQARPLIGEYPAWAAGYVFLNVWIINIAGLALFNRYDFVSMYAFRLVYYLLWHIVWGHVRLTLLF